MPPYNGAGNSQSTSQNVHWNQINCFGRSGKLLRGIERSNYAGMNAPDRYASITSGLCASHAYSNIRFELFLLGEGEKKITEEIDTRRLLSQNQSSPG